MDSLPLHPKLIHLPIALAVLMPIVSIALLAAWHTKFLPRRTWLVAVVLQALLVASGVAAMRSGEGDEERVEDVVPGSAIHAHEEAAEGFVWAGAAVLALALAAAVLKGERVPRALGAAAALGTIVVLFLGYRTGEAGGRLVYQHGAASAYSGPPGAPGADGDRDKDHDDD